MVKKTVKMPEQDVQAQGNFKLVPVGEHRFQITDVIESGDLDFVSAKCEVVSQSGEGLTLLHRLTLNDGDKFFWLTRLFLKAIGEPHTGTVEIDTDAWIGRQFTGRVEHSVSKDKTYANIKEIMFREGDIYIHPTKLGNDGSTPQVSDPKDIQWDG